MMKIEQRKLDAFIGILEALVPECKLMITADGWNTASTDTANVAMVVATLPATAFAEYTVTDKTEIGFDVPKWANMLKVMHDPKSTITIDRQDTGRFKVSDGAYTFTHVPLDPSTVRKRPNAPGINLPATVVINPVELAEVIKAMAVIGDKARFTVGKDGLELAAEGDTDKLRKTLEKKDGSKLPEQPVSSLFSLDYMKDIARAMKGAATVSVHAGQDHPIRFDFEIAGIEASFLVAPRIETDGGAE
jgi:proliferating cell nuclear antigen